MNTYIGRQMPENGIENGIYFDEENNKIKIYSNGTEIFSNNVIKTDVSLFGTWQGKLYDEPIYFNGEFYDIEYSQITFVKSVFNTIHGYIINYIKKIITEEIEILNSQFFNVYVDDKNTYFYFAHLGKYSYSINISQLFIDNNKLFMFVNNTYKYKISCYKKIETQISYEDAIQYLNANRSIEGTYECLNESLKNELFTEEYLNEHEIDHINIYLYNDILTNIHPNFNINGFDVSCWIHKKEGYIGPTYPIYIEVYSDNNSVINHINISNVNFAYDQYAISFAINNNEYVFNKV